MSRAPDTGTGPTARGLRGAALQALASQAEQHSAVLWQAPWEAHGHHSGAASHELYSLRGRLETKPDARLALHLLSQLDSLVHSGDASAQACVTALASALADAYPKCAPSWPAPLPPVSPSLSRAGEAEWADFLRKVGVRPDVIDELRHALEDLPGGGAELREVDKLEALLNASEASARACVEAMRATLRARLGIAAPHQDHGEDVGGGGGGGQAAPGGGGLAAPVAPGGAGGVAP